MTVCDRGGGSKIAKNSVTSFMDGPMHAVHILCNAFIMQCIYYAMHIMQVMHYANRYHER